MKFLRNIAVSISFYILIFAFSISADAATLGKPSNMLGMVAYYTFDGADMAPNARDKSGNGNHANLTNFTSTTTAIGRLGQALVFDGADDYVLGLNIDALESGDMSFCAWINPTAVTGNNWIVNQWTDGGNGPALFTVDDDLRFEVGSDILQHNNILTARTWQQVCATALGTTFSIYYNGALGSSGTRTRAESLATTPFRIGGSSGLGSVNSFAGHMDDVRVFSRALSAGEIKALYAMGSAKLSAGRTPTGLESGLVAHYTFDGADMTSNVRDASGQGKHANLVGYAATTSSLGKVGQALSFNGDGQYVQIPTAPSVTAPYTQAFWFYPTQVDTFQGLIYRGLAAAGQGIGLGGSGIEIDSYAPGASFRTWCNGIPSLNEWHHVAIIINSSVDSGLWKCYIDGADAGVRDPDNAGTYADPGTSDWTIGAYYNNSAWFRGKMDDVRIYNRSLSANEVKQLYNLGAGQKTNSSGLGKSGTLSTGLVGHWTFDGADMAPNVRDKSGQGNHGNLSGQTSTTTAIGKIGQALHFDRVDDFVNVGDVPNADGGNAVTVAGWVKHDVANIGSDSECIATKVRSGFPGWQLCRSAASGTYGFGVSTDGGSDSAITDAVYRDTVWHHVVGVYNGSNVQIYVDGSPGDSTPPSLTGTITDNGYPLCIGSWDNDCQGFSNATLGVIDDVRIYNRALSASEVMQLYNMGR